MCQKPHITFRTFLDGIYPTIAQAIFYADVLVSLGDAEGRYVYE